MFETFKAKVKKAQKELAQFMSGDERGITDAVEIVKALGLIVVIGAIFVFIADRVLTATGTPTNTYLHNFSNQTLSAADTGSGFIIILIIAFIGGIAISYLYMFTGKRR